MSLETVTPDSEDDVVVVVVGAVVVGATVVVGASVVVVADASGAVVVSVVPEEQLAASIAAAIGSSTMCLTLSPLAVSTLSSVVVGEVCSYARHLVSLRGVFRSTHRRPC